MMRNEGVDRPHRDSPGTGRRRLLDHLDEANSSTLCEQKRGHLFVRTKGIVNRISISGLLICIIILIGCGKYSRDVNKSESSQLCGGLQIVTTQHEFENALKTEYQILAKNRSFCVPPNNYDPTVVEANTVRLVKAGDHVAGSASLPRAVMFMKPEKYEETINPFGRAYSLSVASGGPTVWNVLPGDYRMVLQYKTGKCVGKMSTEVCLVASEPFRILNGSDFVVEE